MSRQAKLKPSYLESRESWVVNIPKELSDTGARRQMFFDTKSEASTLCEQLKTRRDDFGLSLLDMSPARIAEASKAYRLLQPYDISLLDAVREHVQRYLERTSSRSWRVVVDEYLAMPKKRSPKYSKDLKETGESMRSLDETLISEISPQDIDRVLAGYAPSTRNAKLRILRAVFNLGVKRKYLRESPIAQLDFAELDAGEVEVFTVDQSARLLQAALDHDLQMLPWFVLGLFCGIRPNGELGKLNWSSVHFAEKQVVISPEVSKTKRRRFIDITDNALEWLGEYKRRGGSITGKIVPARKFTNRRRAIQVKAGVDKWIQQGMRHSFCSYWLAKHQDANKLVLQSGHTDAQTMWDNYHAGVTRAEAEKF
jgi:integrase